VAVAKGFGFPVLAGVQRLAIMRDEFAGGVGWLYRDKRW